MPMTPRFAFVSGLGFGGSTTLLCNLAGELTRRGVPVLVISPEKENPFASDFQRAGVVVVLHDQRRMIFEDRMASMLRNLAEFQPTVVVGCLGAISYEVLRYVPSGIRRVAVIQADGPIFYEAVRPYAGCVDDLIGISTAITRRLKQMKPLEAVAKHCLLNGVPVPETLSPRGHSDQPLRLLYFGRIIHEQKRVHLFPKILETLKISGIPFQWTIAGEGDQRAKLERLMVSDQPAQQIRFIGALPNSKVPALLGQHDVFLLASDAEGLPISLLEAMAHGVVPVVSDLESGIRDVVDATNGILVPVNDVEGYARAIIHLHEHRDELAAKSAAAHERVKKGFSVEAMADRWLKAFPPPASEVQWPSTWRIRPPLTHSRNPRFWPLIRMLRRIGAKLRM